MPSRLTLRMGRKLLTSLVIPALLGVVIFAICEWVVFDINLWNGAREFRALSPTLWWCGLGLCLSILVAGWSIGGAFLRLMELFWGWLRLFGAGGR